MTRHTQLALTLTLTLLATTASAQRHGRAQPDDALTPMQRAMACRSTTDNEVDRNNCIINALRGATNMQELGMLGSTLIASGRQSDAVRTIRTYIQRYPEGPMVRVFTRYIDARQ